MKREMGEMLAVIQDHFAIREDLRIDFTSQAGELHAGRILHAMGKAGMEPSLETISLLCERIEKTPATGAKLVDALIVEIQAATEGEAEPVRESAPENFAGCGLCHGGVVILPIPGGPRNEVHERAVYCDCGRGQFLWSANGKQQLCLVSRPDLKAKAFARQREERAAAGSTLIRFGIDPDAPEEEQLRKFREAILRMKLGIGRSAVPPPASRPVDRDTAMRALKSRRRPPEHLNPEKLALAVYANGDERNEW